MTLVKSGHIEEKAFFLLENCARGSVLKTD